MKPRAVTPSADPFGRSWLTRRLPVLFQAPQDQRSAEPIESAGATPERFTVRVILGAPRYTLPGALLVAVNMVCRALIAVIIGAALDRAVATAEVGPLITWLAVLAADFLVLTLCYRLGSRMGFFGMQQVQHRLRTTITSTLLDPRGAGHGHSDGQALTIATTDVFRLAATMQIGIYPVGQAASLAFCAVALTLISWPLGVAVLVGAVMLIGSMFMAGSPLQRRTVTQQRRVAESVGRASDLLSGYRVLKGLKAEDEAARRYADASREALHATLDAKAAQGLYTGSMNAIVAVFTAVLTVVAGLLAVNGSVSVGGLVAAAGLIQFLVGPLTALPTHVGAVWASGVASARRVLSVLNAPVGSAGAADADRTPEPGCPPAVGQDPSAAAGAGLRATVPDVELSVRPGECVGVDVGQLGAARLVRALAASLPMSSEPDDAGPDDAGPVTLDGHGPQAWGLDAWRRRVLVAPHRAELFDGTIMDNVRVHPHLTDAGQAFDALTAAACEDLLGDSGAGPDTPVGEGGTRLSGGQRQRVALARAYAAEPEILVLHQPTSAVDAATEARIARRLRAVRAGRSTVIVTSSPALLAVCDRVVGSAGACA